MADTQNNKIVRAGALNTALQHIKDWMPFDKTKEGIRVNDIHVGNVVSSKQNSIFSVSGSDNSNIFEIEKDGTIWVLDVEKNQQKKLQELLDVKPSIIINNQQEWDNAHLLDSIDNFGMIVYLCTTITHLELPYDEGIYIISINASDHGKAKLLPLVSSGGEGGWDEQKYQQLLDIVNSHSKDIEKLQADVLILNEFKDTPIPNSFLEEITGMDLNGNGEIEKDIELIN